MLSAIYRKLITSRSHDVFSFGHDFSDYPWHHHDKQESIGIPEEEKFVHSWRYLILLTLAKVLLNQDNSQPWSDEAAEELTRIEKFVLDSYGSRDPDVSQFFSPARSLHMEGSLKIPLKLFEFKISGDSVPANDGALCFR